MFDDSEDHQENDNTTVNYREELLKLINEGRIKHTVKWAEKASDDKLEKTYANYLASQLDETNEHITDTLIKQLSGLMTTLDLVDDGESLEKDLENSKLFKRDIKKIMGYVTPYIPLIGLVCGGVCVASHVMKKLKSEKTE